MQRSIWSCERDIERSVAGADMVLVGPWTGEVGYEVLYWVPFLRWLCAAYRLAPQRLIAVSRGGTASWYARIANTYVDVFDVMTPQAFGERSRALAAERATSKQLEPSALDGEIVAAVSNRLGAQPRILHPSLMFRLFRAFWSGHESMSFLESRTRYARVEPPGGLASLALPREYAAVKFYTARSLPAAAGIRGIVRSMVADLAQQGPVVVLDTDVRVDEHEDFSFDDIPNVQSARSFMTPATNLAVQTDIIAGARAFAGTCGSVAWLAPMLGVDTMAVLADAEFLHAHLHVGRRVFQRLEGAGKFSPVDIGVVARLGHVVGS